MPAVEGATPVRVEDVASSCLGVPANVQALERTPLPGWSELVRHDIPGARCPVSSWNRYVDTAVEAHEQPVLEGLPSGEVVDLDWEDAVVWRGAVLWRGGRRSG